MPSAASARRLTSTPSPRSPLTVAFALLLALAAVLLAGCSAGGSGKAADPPGASTAGGASTAAFPRTVTHDKGTTVVPAKPKRVIALDNSLVEAVADLGTPVVGGISAYRDQKGFPAYLGDAVKDAKDVGPLASPNLELIASLKPDLIISATVRHDALYPQLSAIAPTVFVKTTGPQWKDNIKLVGQALGADDKATALLAAYQARAKKIGDEINALPAFAGAPADARPTVSVVRFLDGPTRIYLPKTFSGIVLADMGLTRPAGQRDPEKFNVEVSEEQIQQIDADYLFVSTFSGGADRRARFEANPLWQRLKAVQAQHVFEVDDEKWMTSVSLHGANSIMDDLAKAFAVDPARS